MRGIVVFDNKFFTKLKRLTGIFACVVLLGFFLTQVLYGQILYRYDSNKENAKALFNQGVIYFHNKSYEAAINKFLQSLRVRSENNFVRYYLGLAFLKAGYTQNAIEQWENIIKLGGQDAHLVEKLNYFYAQRGQVERQKTPYSDYVFLHSIPHESSRQRLIKMPTGLYVNDANEVYVLDFIKNNFLVIDANSKFKRNIYAGERSNLPYLSILRNPYELIYGSDGLFYISDFGNNRVVAMNKQGKVVRIYNPQAATNAANYDDTSSNPNIASDNNISLDNNKLLGPSGIALDENNNLFVSDTGNCTIHYYSKAGELLYRFGGRGREDGKLLLPSGLSYSEKDKRLYVVDRGNNRIVVFSSSGEFISNLGGDFLDNPRKVMIDKKFNDRLVILDKKNVYHYQLNNGKYSSLLYSLGDNKNNFQDRQPVSMVYDNLGALYIGDAKAGKIHVYNPIKTLYVNLQVQIERIYLRDFPKKVMAEVSVKNKEGQPISWLLPSNFKVMENGTNRPFVFNKKRSAYNSFRRVVLVETSKEAESRSVLMKTLLTELFTAFDAADESRLYRFGGGNEKGQSTYKMALPYNNSILRNVDKAIKGRYYQNFYVGSVIRKAINDSLKQNHRKAIVLVSFQPYNEQHFKPENYNDIVEFARNNMIPIYVIYAGVNVNLNADELYFLKYLANATGGKFVVYNNKASIDGLVQSMKNFKDGIYQLNYASKNNDLKKGAFRNVHIRVNYNNLTGEDIRGGYPVP